MNYRHIYLRIISHAKQEEKLGLRKKGNGTYYERHHILPRSLFPLWVNRKSNLVLLTAREHLFCHQLLTKTYPGQPMDYALMMMVNRGFVISSREYERLRIRFSHYASELAKQSDWGVATRWGKGHMPWNKGIALTDEHKKKVSEGTKRGMSKIDMGAKMQAWIASLTEEENLERKRKAGLHRKMYGDDNPMANPIHRETVKQKRNEAAALYKEYKKNGGEVSWNEWNKLHARGLI